MEPAEAVLRFLQGVGRGSEAEFYLRLFRSRAAESFATLVIDHASLTYHIDAVTLDLRFLRQLDLTPLVVLGLSDPSHASQHAFMLRDELEQVGVTGTIIEPDAHFETVRHEIKRGAVPLFVLTHGEHEARLRALGALLTALGTHKLIFVDGQGGLRTGEQLISVVNLNDEYSVLMAEPRLRAGAHELLGDSRKLIYDIVPHRLLIAITSPMNLLYELFTVKGAGTLLRRGAGIRHHVGLKGVDLAQLAQLLTASFGTPPPKALFERPITHAYVEESYRGAALMMACPYGGYLTKFAVTREAQGEGIGRDLWQALTADYPRVLWRAKSNNPIAAWYEKQCDGRVRADTWNVYWKGIPLSEVPGAVEYALAQPLDFTSATVSPSGT